MSCNCQSVRPIIFLAASACLTLIGSARAASEPTPRLLTQGGPDAYGYVYVDNINEPTGPVFATEFEDISATGTLITWGAYNPPSAWGVADEGEAQVNLGFTFSYYGNTYSDCWVNTNGFLKFGSSTVNTADDAYVPTTIPAAGGDNNKICALWRDFTTVTVRYAAFGTAPDRRFVVHWVQGTESAQLRIYENGTIVVLIQNTGGNANGTIGIEDSTGTGGLLYIFNGDPITLVDNRAIRFTLPTGTPPPDPTGLGQFLADGTTPIATAGITTEASVVLNAVTNNPNSVTRRLQVEVRPTSQAFTGVFTQAGVDSTGGALTVGVPGLSVALYHWRARVFEPGTGLASNWVAYGGNDNPADPTDPSGATDFEVQTPPVFPLPDPTGLGQFLADGTTPIATGGITIDSTTVVMKAMLDNPGAEARQLQVEILPSTQPFAGVPTHSGENPATSVLTLKVFNLPEGNYHWRVRVVEPDTGSISNWVGFGGNDNPFDPTDPNGPTDFSIPLGVGGPDAFGYTYRDDRVLYGPVYSVDIEDLSTTGTPITFAAYGTSAANDEGEAQIPLGFSFPFYGNEYTDLWVNTNGFVKFGSSTVPDSTAYVNATVPTVGGDDNKICVKWQNWFVNSVRYATFGTAPNRRFVVHWFGQSSVELKLFENGYIVIQIQATNGNTDGTVGLENSTGTVGLLYSFESVPSQGVRPGRAIRFVPMPPPPPSVPLSSGGGGSSGGCGSVGLDVLMPLGLLKLWRSFKKRSRRDRRP